MQFTAAQSTLDTNRGTIKNRQFRDTGNSGHARYRTKTNNAKNYALNRKK